MVFIDSPSLYFLKTRFQQATIPPLFRIAQQIVHIGLIQQFFNTDMMKTNHEYMLPLTTILKLVRRQNNNIYSVYIILN